MEKAKQLIKSALQTRVISLCQHECDGVIKNIYLEFLNRLEK